MDTVLRILRVFDKSAVTAHRFVACGVAGPDFDEAPTFLPKLDGLGERAVRGGVDLLSVDLHPGAGLGSPADDEDTTVGFDVVEVKLRRRLVHFAVGMVERVDAELAWLAPRSLDAVLAVGGHPPLEGPFAAHAERGAGLGPVAHVDDVVYEEVIARHLERVAC